MSCVSESCKGKGTPGTSERLSVKIQKVMEIAKRVLINYEVVSSLGVGQGHLQTARTDTLVRDTSNSRLSLEQLKKGMNSRKKKKDPNRT